MHLRAHAAVLTLSTLLALSTLVALVAAPLAVPAPASAGVVRPLVNGNVADPAVAVSKGKRYVVVGTGPQVVRYTSRTGRRWTAVSPALVRRPAWSRPAGEIWASDIVRLRGRWVLYFAAPVRGLQPSSRCIGVAVADTAAGRFVPVGSEPLVCPPGSKAPTAQDPVLDPGRTEPTIPTYGAIDPSLYQGPGGTSLVYKTDGRPSSIRIVPLQPNGLTVAGTSRTLLVSDGVVENPVLVKHGGFFYLFNSAGDYTRCSYSTVFRRSRSMFDWTTPVPHPILTRARTRLCGPGGADVLVEGRGRRATVTMYFHAWTCAGSGRPCKEPFHAWQGKEDHRQPVRSLYGVRLRFTKAGFPVRAGWIRPRR